MDILGGTLAPTLYDGSTQDLVYGVDALGRYIGLVPTAAAAQVADRAPPRSESRWSQGAWLPYADPIDLAAQIDQDLSQALEAGVLVGGRRFYTDDTFSLHLTAFLQAFSSGILPVTAKVGVRCMDKIVYQLTLDELKTAAASVMTYVQQQYAIAWARKAAIAE